MPDPAYVLGHAASEVRRLELQAALSAPGTERILAAAGLGPGMRVLDIGAGAGDVSMIAAALVGPSGSVLGIDREAAVLERARERARAAGLAHLRYEAATLDTLPADQTFDAVVSRHVLQHQPDPAAFLRAAAGRVRPGGLLVCIAPELADDEHGRPWSSPAAGLYDDTHNLVLTAFKLADIDLAIGSELERLFRRAGLTVPELRTEAVDGGADSPLVEYNCLSLGTMLPVLERHGVTTAHEAGLDTLQGRMREAVARVDGRLWTIRLAGAWARVG